MLELAPRFELAPLLRLKIWNKRPPSRGSVLGTIYETYTVLLINVTFEIVQN